MNVRRLVRLRDDVPAIIAHPDHKLMHLETRRHFEIFVEYLQTAFMRGFVVFADAAGRSRQEITYFMIGLLKGASVGRQAASGCLPES
jgi:hypothetical protein